MCEQRNAALVRMTLEGRGRERYVDIFVVKRQAVRADCGRREWAVWLAPIFVVDGA